MRMKRAFTVALAALEGTPHGLGASRSDRDLDERRHARHPDGPPGQPVGTRVADARGICATGRGDEASRDRAVNQETVLRNEFGVRTFGYTSFVVDPPDGQVPALTPAGLARQRASFGVGTFGDRPFNDFEDFSLYDRCITRGVGGIKQYMGDGRGHWDGDTLAVETTNFTDRVGFLGPNSDALKLTERFTRIDPQMIDYRIRVEDPVTYTAPFTIRFTITQQPGYELFEYSCHEGNGAVGNALSGERAYEKSVADAIARGLPIPLRTMGMEVYTGGPVEGREAVREFGVSK
jgi:hypothetical protein